MSIFTRLLKRIKPASSVAEKPPQLIMWYLHEDAPTFSAVEGCNVRLYRPGDEEAWLSLLQANGELGVWTRERIDQVFTETHVQLFVECDGLIVACTGINDKVRDDLPCWEIGWVAVHPEFQGRGIGKLISGSAVEKALELGSRPIYLLTDDFRVPALCSYLKLGFTPDNKHSSYAERWREIFAGLGADYQVYEPSYISGDQPQ